VSEQALWRFFLEVRRAVAAGNSGGTTQPYRRGTFLVSARAGDVELTIKDVSEEDAILIAAELTELGVHTLVRSSVVCPSCGLRVPAQAFCSNCRKRLPPSPETPP